ncbi:DUF1640 domain-containing protein [Candidatus Sodalis sp. SoCistrobi]|uniref:DUF1640 domain-containing protein n=1 Tax=Candidatus Sodalis sp. SoCistrobi TaxID=1922216 RepID=UPI00093B2E18|nr:DUF1640 domain-containing protein [Candidatus Sodalis sp. SoCistrobi]
MGQVAFDTLQASEELETAGISREQARAISLVVRKSHEVADVATKTDIVEVKRDISDVRKDLTAQITDVRKDMEARFEKTDAQIADVRKDLSAEIADVRKDMANRFDKLGLQMTVRMGGMLIAAVGLMTAILKVLK